jgi:hypothetical protein
MGVFEKIIGFFQERFGKLSGEQKRRLILICTALFVIILIISVIMSMPVSNRSEADKMELDSVSELFIVSQAIPAEELFLGDEPDYLPGVLLERERRENWSEQDAYEFWQDPLRSGEEQWRIKIEAAIDEFLERVP